MKVYFLAVLVCFLISVASTQNTQSTPAPTNDKGLQIASYVTGIVSGGLDPKNSNAQGKDQQGLQTASNIMGIISGGLDPSKWGR